GTDTFRNSVTGKSFTEPFHNSEFAELNGDLQPDKLTTVGVTLRLTVPGEGAVLLDVGRIVESPGHIEFEAGPHQALEGDLADVCAARAWEVGQEVAQGMEGGRCSCCRIPADVEQHAILPCRVSTGWFSITYSHRWPELAGEWWLFPAGGW